MPFEYLPLPKEIHVEELPHDMLLITKDYCELTLKEIKAVCSFFSKHSTVCRIEWYGKDYEENSEDIPSMPDTNAVIVQLRESEAERIVEEA